MSRAQFRSSFRGFTALAALLVAAPALHAQLPGVGGLPGGDPGDGPGFPAPCGIECFGSAAEAVAQCRADGGSLWDCLGAYREALVACREEAGCDDGPGLPEIPDVPRPCGIECFASARDTAMACLEGGGTREDCVAAYLDALGACREAAGCADPEPPRPPVDRPRPCGLECFGSARDAVMSCRAEGGGLRDCVGAFIEAFRACRAEACAEEPGDEEPGDEEPGDEDPGDEEADEVVGALLASLESFERGDVNRDGTVDLSDPVALLNHLFLQSAAPSCADAADANDDGALDISDPTAILITLFLGGGPLPAPSVEAGIDPTPDALDCSAR